MLSCVCTWVFACVLMRQINRYIELQMENNIQKDLSCWVASPTCLCSELIKAADGGQISLDWFDNDDSLSHPDPATRPTVLLLPGLTGTSRESYILHMVQQSRDLGYRWVVLAGHPGWGPALSTKSHNLLSLLPHAYFHTDILSSQKQNTSAVIPILIKR